MAIVGSGPRGTYLFSALVRDLKETFVADPVEVFWIDPFIEAGGEVYNRFQPSYLIMNTVAEQLTTEPDDLAAANGGSGSTMADWMRSSIDPSLPANTYASRSAHGEYLLHARREAMAALPANVKVHCIAGEVIRVEKRNGYFTLELAGGQVIERLSSLAITTGRGTPENVAGAACDDPAKIANPYPLDRWMEGVSNRSTVGLEGMGLTSVDAIVGLTQGRGGRFERREGKLVYLASGREPQIVAWSRSGIPLLAKASNQKGATGRHVARFLTTEAIDALRRKSEEEGRGGRLDFEREVLPLVSREISLAACLSFVDKRVATEDIDGESYLAKHFQTLPAECRLDWETVKTRASRIEASSQAEYSAKFRELLEDDLREAQRGNIESCLKAATDCLRDIRDGIRYAVEWRGLTPESARVFENEFAPVYMRVAVGVPLVRIEQMLALWDAGILHMDLGPSPVVARVSQGGYEVGSGLPGGASYLVTLLVQARITSPAGGRMAKALLESDLCRLAENRVFGQRRQISALDVDSMNRAIDPRGTVVPGLSIYGALIEGLNWYTYTAARPFVGSRVLRDAENWAEREVNRLFQEPACIRSEGYVLGGANAA